MQFSIITPSYNPDPERISQTLYRILENTGSYEIIVVLQKTSMETIEKIHARFKYYENVVFIVDDGVGISRARNIAISESKGEWVLLLDDDVYVYPDLISKLQNISAIEALFYFGNIYKTGSNEHYLKFYATSSKLGLFNYNRVCSVALVINRIVFRKIGLFDENLGAGCFFGSSEESDFILRALLSKLCIRRIDDHDVFHDQANPSLEKVESYARGLGALYRKYLFRYSLGLNVKLICDLLVRIFLTLSLSKRRIFFVRGVYRGFVDFPAVLQEGKINDKTLSYRLKGKE